MSRARILVGDVRDRLKEIADGSVQTAITSPPYWGLRDYGTATWEGGNDPKCQHRVAGQVPDGKAPAAITTGQRPGVDASRCRECGAVRRDYQIGLEQTPDAYVAEMVAVFREVRRVLADDGTLWLNLGDSYFSDTKGSGGAGKSTLGPKRDLQNIDFQKFDPIRLNRVPGVKPKDLVGIPWRVAFALQADGWYLRQDIIWAKPNPMPESVTDRPTRAHEYLFLLTKSPRYFYDLDAVRLPVSPNWRPGAGAPMPELGDHRRSDGARGHQAKRAYEIAKGANRRTVWTVPTKPFRGAHFAVMPEALVEPCVLAGSERGDLVLDPFAGSGTVGVVALRHGRDFVGVELNPEYANLARERITADAPLLNEVIS